MLSRTSQIKVGLKYSLKLNWIQLISKKIHSSFITRLRLKKKVMQILQYIHYPSTVNFIFPFQHHPLPSRVKAMQQIPDHQYQTRMAMLNPRWTPKQHLVVGYVYQNQKHLALYYNLKWLKGKTSKFKLPLNLFKYLFYCTGLHVSSSVKRLH